MNEELIKTLAESAGFDIFLDSIYVKNEEGIHRATNEVHRFAELIVRECADWIKNTDSDPDIGEEDAKALLEHFGVEE